MTSFRFFLDWELNCQFAGLIWARETGLYKAAGLDVDLVSPSAAVARSVLESVLNDPGSAGCMEDNLIVRACGTGIALRAIGAMLQDTPMVLMTAPDSGIRTLTHLAGRRVAMHKDGVHLLETVLTLHGMDPKAADTVVGGWTLGDLINGRFDAVQGYSITEPAELRACGFEPLLIPVAHHHLHPYAQMMFTTKQTIEERTGDLAAFVRVTLEGWQAVLQNAERGGRLVATVSDEHPDAGTNACIISAMRRLVVGEDEVLGVMGRERWRRNLMTYAAYGMVEHAVYLDDVIDERFVVGQ